MQHIFDRLRQTRATVDPRWGQITALIGLIVLGIYIFKLEIGLFIALGIVASAMATQFISTRCLSDLPSALISALSLCLLLRTHDLLIASLAAVIGIASKQIIRYRGQHIFNPSAFALVVVTVCFEQAWLTPGQWGHNFNLLIAICAAGLAVTRTVSRIDVSLSFLGVFTLICLLRALYLGDPLAIPMHQINNGALLIFSFFMISDPRTTPENQFARSLFGASVAGLAAYLNFVLHVANAPLYALVLTTPLVPLLNYFLPSNPFHWRQSRDNRRPIPLTGV